MSFTMPAPKDVVDAITDDECSSLQQNTGIDPAEGIDDCQAIDEQILPLIEQELNAIATGVKTIFANEDSKCKEGDENPTLASILSRIYRAAQAITCAICTYDPQLTTCLKTGKASQILWGQGTNVLPVWKTPDALPTENSGNVVTSDGVYQAIQQALLGTFHLWQGHEEFDYYAKNVTELNNQTGMDEDNTALVLAGADGMNQLYTYDGSAWIAGEVYGVIEDFATTHIKSGNYEDDEIYFYYNDEDTTATWNVLDAGLGDITAQIQQLLDITSRAVLGATNDDRYLFTSRTTLAGARAVPSTTGYNTIVLITGNT